MLPAGFNKPAGDPTSTGMTNIELAAKYRLLHQDTFGLDVSLFPRVFLPSGSNTIGYSRAGVLLPIWVQKDWGGGWSAFGGGGCMVGGLGTEDFRVAGAVPTYQLLPSCRSARSFFHQTADRAGTPATSSLSVGLRCDLNDNHHLLGYVSRGVENINETNQFIWYASIPFTFRWIRRPRLRPNANPCRCEPTGISRKVNGRRAITRWPVKDLPRN